MLYPPSMNRIHSYELFSYLLRFQSDIKLHCFSLKKEAAVSSVKQHCNTKATVCVQHTQSDTAVSIYTGFLFCFAHFPASKMWPSALWQCCSNYGCHQNTATSWLSITASFIPTQLIPMLFRLVLRC